MLEVRDLWPESAIAMGLIGDGPALAAARRLEAYCYRRADRIVALTEGIRDGLMEAGVPAAEVALITNGVDLEIGNGSAPAAAPVPADAFVAMYVGAHGTYSSLETVLDAAAACATPPTCGSCWWATGTASRRLVESARRRGLDNVAFVDPVPKREVPAWLARADACVLPYQDEAVFAGALPNKAFDYLGAGRPIVASAPAGRAHPDGRAGRLRRRRAPGGRRGAGRRHPRPRRRPRRRPPDGRARPRLRPGRTTTAPPWPPRFVATVESVA